MFLPGHQGSLDTEERLLNAWIMGLRCRDLPCQGPWDGLRPCACAVGSAQAAEGSLSLAFGCGCCEPRLGECWHMSHTIQSLDMRGLESSQKDAVHSLGGCRKGTRDTLMWPFIISTFLQETDVVFKHNLIRNTSSFSVLHFHGKH